MSGAKTIFFSACEPSADSHCANLIKALGELSKEPVKYVGIGGDRMEKAGCELIANPVGRAAMIYNAFAQINFYRKLLANVKQYFAENKPAVVVVCDSPAFNFHVAKAARKAGAKVLYYVAPQLWAWAPWRIRKMRKSCDKLACILPFEENWFIERGVPATFVGNPLFDGVHIDIESSSKSYEHFDFRAARIALMPGSRDAEIKTLWKPMQRIVRKLKHTWDAISVVACAADEEKLAMLKSREIGGFECEYKIGDVAAAAGEADFAIVASGSATLQVAGAGCPMVVMYQSSRLAWHLLGRWLVRTRFLSLVNILAGRELVPEFMPYFNSTEPIYQRCKSLLKNRSLLAKTSRDLVELASPMAGGSASEKTARLILEMM